MPLTGAAISAAMAGIRKPMPPVHACGCELKPTTQARIGNARNAFSDGTLFAWHRRRLCIAIAARDMSVALGEPREE
jgi:hypothetical protein